jgi:hypothetical protein
MNVIWLIPEYALETEAKSRQELANELIQALLNGLRPPSI